MTGRRIACLLSFLVLVAPLALANPPPKEVWTFRGETYLVVSEAELKARGLPRRDIPAEDNAAWPLLEAAEIWTGTGDLIERAMDPNAELDEGEVAELEAWVAENATAFALMEEAASRTDCQFPFFSRDGQLGDIFASPLIHLAELRDMARGCVMRGRLASERDDIPAALESQLLAVRIGRTINGSGHLIADLVGIACESTGIKRVVETALSELPGEDTLEWLGSQLERIASDRPTWVDAFRAEQAAAHRLVDRIFSAATPGDHARLFRVLFPDRTMKAEIDAFYIEYIALADEPPWEAARFAKRADRDETLARISKWNVPTRMLLPALDSALGKYIQAEAFSQAARLAIALRRFHLAEGVWPQRLDALSPRFIAEVPVDPFTGEPFVYKPREDGWTLYSVGSNLEDDGGDEEFYNDIVVRFPVER